MPDNRIMRASNGGQRACRIAESRLAYAMQVAISHMTAMAAAWFCFMLALVTATAAGASLDKPTAQLAGAGGALVGFLLLSVGGWLGGRLVYEFGIGVTGRRK
jgi:uncharacterized membrane protein